MVIKILKNTLHFGNEKNKEIYTFIRRFFDDENLNDVVIQNDDILM